MSTSPLAVRRAVPGDARRIAEIQVEGWRFAYRGAMPGAVLDALSVETRAAQHRAGLEHDAAASDVRRWVATQDERVLGFLIDGPCRDADLDARVVGEVYAMYVDPARVGTGVGRALMDHALGALGARGYREATLLVLASNQRAQRFYACAGFAPDGHTEPATFGGVERIELRYRRALPPR